jgi:hypothetical protein
MTGSNPYLGGRFEPLKLEPHLHTVHSDGQDTVTSMFEACRLAGYDVVALTDHNTLSGLAEAHGAAEKLGLILIPGVEVTTFRGHAVVLGVSRVPEWRDLESRGIGALADETHSQGGVLTIAHPSALGSPVCSGCQWEWPISPGSADLCEVFAADEPTTDVPLVLWRQMLEQGASIGPVGPGDVHSTQAARAARPATYVYARSRTLDDVMDALRHRRISASVGTRLDFWLEGEGGVMALAGDQVADERWSPRTAPTVAANVQEVTISSLRRCLYAELRDDQAQLAAVTAPIWIDTSQ